MASLGTRAAGNILPSFGFSGAGFLTCYHLGAADCLLKRGVLLPRGELPVYDDNNKNDNKKPVLLTGVSGGAMVATAVSIGMSPEDGMRATLNIAENSRKTGGILNHLRPGFSLVDQVEDAIKGLVRDVDEEFALRRIDHGRLLRIGLTDSRTFPRFRRNPNAYLYVDKYDNLEEIISACILSSYIPGLTGPLSAHKSPKRNGAVRRANQTMIKMLKKGFIKDALGLPLQEVDTRQKPPSTSSHNILEDFQNDILFWDGGLANVFPTIDKDTCVITPFSGCFRNPSISPSFSNKVPRNSGFEESCARPEICLENLRTLRYIAFSSESLALEKWFEQGFNDANRFLAGFNVANTEHSISSLPVMTNTQMLAQNVTEAYTAVSPQPIRDYEVGFRGLLFSRTEKPPVADFHQFLLDFFVTQTRSISGQPIEYFDNATTTTAPVRQPATPSDYKGTTSRRFERQFPGQYSSSEEYRNIKSAV